MPFDLTHLDKVFFPKHKYTKGDLIEYYQSVAQYINPYLKDRPETFALLRKLGISMVIIDSPGRWPASKEITTDILYIRFHGSKWLYRSSYTHNELESWAAFIKQATTCRKAFAYFNNDHAAAAVANAQYLQKILAKPPAS